MKRILYSTAFMLALLATGCGDANQKTSGLPQIDVRTDYPEKEICLQDECIYLGGSVSLRFA